MNYTGSQVPAQVSRERSQAGFPPLLMENLQPGSTVGSVISVGMLNQHLAISTEGMELGGLWDQWWPPRRDTGGTGVTQQCLAVEGAIPVAGNTGGKLVAQHPIPVCCSRTNSSPGSLRCHFGNRTLPSCSPKEKNPSGPPFPAWILHSQDAQSPGMPEHPPSCARAALWP